MMQYLRLFLIVNENESIFPVGVVYPKAIHRIGLFQ